MSRRMWLLAAVVGAAVAIAAALALAGAFTTDSTTSPGLSATLVEGGATVRAVGVGATLLRFTPARTAAGAGALASQDLRPDARGAARYRPPPDHPWVDVQRVRGGTPGPRLRDTRGGRLLRTTPPAPSGHTIVGTNGADGYGPEQAAVVRDAHLTWARTEPGQSSVAQLHRRGFKVLLIAGNPADDRPLSAVDPASYGRQVVAEARAAPGDTGPELLEAGNEMYLKGGSCDPAAYAHLYLAGERALRAAGITTRYLFNLIGTQNGCEQGTPTEWLRGALRAEPGLAARVLANGVSLHPYGVKDANVGDSGGTLAVNAQENLLRTVLGAVPPVYLTELGFNTCGTHGYPWELPPDSDTGTPVKDAIQASLPVLLADPDVKGIWYFQTHDYGTTDCWGLQDADGSPRPQLGVLSAFAIQQGQ